MVASANLGYPRIGARRELKKALEAYWKDGAQPEKFIQTESKLFTQADDPAGEYERRKGLGY